MALLITLSTLCAAQTQTSTEEKIPSLFYSATERSHIEQQRKGGIDTDEGEGGNGGENRSKNASRQIQFNGWVDRKEGKGTLWINQRPWLEGTQDIPGYPSSIDQKNARLHIDGRVLRVGETLDLESRQQTDLLPSGALTITTRSLPVLKK